MRVDSLTTASGPTISWRAIECWGAGISLFVQAGAFLPLILANADGALSDSARSILRLTCFPVYLFTIVILIRNFPQFILAIKRNFIIPLILAAPFLSTLWSIDPTTSLRRAIGLLFCLLLSYVLAIRFTPRQLLFLLFVTFGACIVLSVIMSVVSPNLANMPDGAMRGVFIHKNVLGWYACLMILVATAVLIDGTLGLRRTAFVLLAAGIICLASSGSMTAIIATSAAFCLSGFYSLLQRSSSIGRVVVVLLFVQLSIGILISLHEFLVPALEALGKDATLTGRVPLWELVDREISDRWMLGYGYQAFWTTENPEATHIWLKLGWAAPHAHNGYRDILLSFGIMGMIPFALMLLHAIHQGAVLQCHDPQYGWLWLNVLTIMILVMNLTESFFLVQNDTIFILFTATIIMFSLYAPVVSSRHSPLWQAPSRDVTSGVQMS
ncbi:lipid A core-O-antigen ligase-like enyme [Rhizobium leguminosarum bv. trifolii WSM2297]|uniref:Lipid A core-O-antigen ligase-like enyme n=1 Tax=Rhizobium leguminosarum bv. trifolii WSM2297 TaxID=754762 RepID=J0CKR8_RHILT|nr:O-antigen ligase family protein [Rhizobium leguminosarum]EJC84072.1 lipid A core-O-antigen ligase-like enyme [Rhizobium leguminosarum bv. trifolii WSM2297]EJC84337.1 lipid A core-O-antigen ligase-like enyme [Rhizobium leguminosarum bv. trifolii WSM2297]